MGARLVVKRVVRRMTCMTESEENLYLNST